jgi:hypothetical protein
MAHPTINITQEPSLVCPNPAYNCVKYGFECTDFKTTAATFASFVIDTTALSVVSIAPGSTIKLSGNLFTTDTTNTFELFDASAILTAAILASNLFAAMNFNNDLFTKFDIVQTSATVITATARVAGVIALYDFDSTAFIGTGVTITPVSGIDADYRENYRLIVEIWESESGVPLKQISKESYIPSADGLFSINIGLKVAPLIKSRFAHTLPFSPVSWTPDDIVSKTFCIRYGESYSDTVDSCTNVLRDFVTSDQILVVNSAFQRADAASKTAQICAGEFMSNVPDFTEMCEDSLGFLSMWYGNIVSYPIPPNTEYRAFWEIFYTDGTSSTHYGVSLNPIVNTAPFRNRFALLQHGGTYILFLANPLKTVDYYRARFVVVDTSVPIPTGDTYFGSKYFKMVSCCGGAVEMYFQNEFGGFDTITFNPVDNIEIEQENAIFESFLDCADDVIDTTGLGTKGKGIINQTARDVFEVTSKFADTYQSRKWLREFLTSPEKYVRTTIEGESEIFSKVIVVEGSTKYFSKDDNTLYLRFQYILNEDLNIQKN